ncbi:amidase [Alteromonadaceae bacterium M269]|nr:amidase [Alteromonadaceae bacterium M269]
MKNFVKALVVASVLSACSATSTTATSPTLNVQDLTAASIAEGVSKGSLSSEAVVAAYLARIDALDHKTQSIIALNPNALQEARQLDAEARQGKLRGPLHGVPVLVKDNIETKELPATAGSLALANNDTKRDAPIIAGLREQGAIILGKTNLSEWANFRSNGSISGWSGIGGQTRNPHSLDRTACGSSSGSGAAVAAQYAPMAIGTETNGSIMCPSAMNGVVGFKPTVGMLSRTHVVPISSTQDTAGPMTRTVRDAALMLNAMSRADNADPATVQAGAKRPDFVAALDKDIKGMRIGVLRWAQGNREAITSAFNDAVKVLEAQGAELVDINEFQPMEGIGGAETLLLQTEFKHTLNEYLADAAPTVKYRTLEDLIEFNNNSDRELALFDQSLFTASQETKGIDSQEYKDAFALLMEATREKGIDALLKKHNVDVIVMPSRPAAFLIDAVYGDSYPGGSVGAGWMPAIAGYPIMTVPMGSEKGLPIGFGIMGTAWDDATVLRVGYAYEQASHKILTPTFAESAFELSQTKDGLKRLNK